MAKLTELQYKYLESLERSIKSEQMSLTNEKVELETRLAKISLELTDLADRLEIFQLPEIIDAKEVNRRKGLQNGRHKR